MLLWAICSSVFAGEMIQVPPVEKCFLCSTEPSKTLYWPGQNAKAVLIFIPGGEGYIGLKEGQTDHRFHFFQTLKRLTDPALSRGQTDVVLMDSPGELSPRQIYPTARGSSDHLIRIESVMRFYKTKTGLPVWLMGHSNGDISLTEFVKYARKNDKLDLIGGMIVSAVRNEAQFDAPLGFPMLFLHHRQDGCQHTQPSVTLQRHESTKRQNTAPTDYVHVLSGQSEPRDPCRSGFHMYFEAGPEAADRIDEFMARFAN